jgi:hypothetical protein
VYFVSLLLSFWKSSAESSYPGLLRFEVRYESSLVLLPIAYGLVHVVNG